MKLSLAGSIIAWYLWGALYAAVWPALKVRRLCWVDRQSRLLTDSLVLEQLGADMYWVPYVCYSLAGFWLSTFLMVVVSMIVTFT